jgi:spore coat polysaccharide biosynthesis protein SpsF
MRRVAIVQARMTSTRLAGKVLADVCGQPMLARELGRVMAMKEQDEVVVATTTNAADDAVADLARRSGARVFRGDEHDVLGRYLGAAREAKADVVVRLTADCPLLDPAESDRVVRALVDRAGEADYASNVLRRTYPRGLDTEAFFMDALERAARLGRSGPAREHVTWVMHTERRDLFLRHAVVDPSGENASDLRWTVDTPDDLRMVRKVYETLHLADRPWSYLEVLYYIRAHPEVAAINAHVEQKGV